MAKLNITQENLNEYLTSTDGFWKSFQKSLKAPFSSWNDFKEHSKDEWAHECKTDDDMAGYLNIIFDNTPVLKGEFPTVYADGSGLILTNYRLFFNDDDGLLIIPLKDLIFYGERVIKGGDGWLDSDEEKFIIEYNINGKTEEIELHQWILPEWVEKAKNAEEYNDLDDTANSLLRLTFYDYEKNDLEVEKIEYLPDPIVEEKTLDQDTNNQEEQKEDTNSNEQEYEKEYFEFDEESTDQLIVKRKKHILWLIGFVGLGIFVSLISSIQGTYEKDLGDSLSSYGSSSDWNNAFDEVYGGHTTTEDIMGFARLLLILLIPAFGYVIYLLGIKWKDFPKPDDLKKIKEIEYAKITSGNLSIRKKNGLITGDQLSKCNLLLNQFKWAMLIVGFSFLMSSALVMQLMQSQGALGALLTFALIIILQLVPYWYWNMRMDVLLKKIKETIPWHKSPS